MRQVAEMTTSIPGSPDQRYRARADVGAYPFSSELILIDSHSEVMYALNPTGVQIWELLCAGHTLQSICERLSSDTGIAPSQLHGDVQDFVTSLLQAGLLDLS